MTVFLYIFSIVAVNYAFTVVPLIALPDGTLWPPVSLAVGLVFVLRDFAQRQIGHWVLAAMLTGGAISYVMADPYVAVASVAAFLISEAIDWLVYTATGRSFARRVLVSSAVSTPVDSAVFLLLIGQLSPVGVLAMTLSKMIAAVAVAAMVRRRAA